MRIMLSPWAKVTLEAASITFEEPMRTVTLEGKGVQRFLPQLLPALNGERSEQEIVDDFDPQFRPVATGLLDALRENGLLLTIPEDYAGNDAAVGSLAMLTALHPAASGDGLAQNLVAGRVVVLGGGALAESIAHELGRTDLVKVDRDEWRSTDAGLSDRDFVVAAPRAEEIAQLEEWNVVALDRRVRWLQARPFDGRVSTVGPAFIPYETCCYECYRTRMAMNRPLQAWDDEAARTFSTVESPTLDSLVASVAAMFALRCLARSDREMAGVAYTLTLGRGLAVDQHVVIRVPRCEACSSPRTRTPMNPWFPGRDA